MPGQLIEQEINRDMPHRRLVLLDVGETVLVEGIVGRIEADDLAVLSFQHPRQNAGNVVFAGDKRADVGVRRDKGAKRGLIFMDVISLKRPSATCCTCA